MGLFKEDKPRAVIEWRITDRGPDQPWQGRRVLTGKAAAAMPLLIEAGRHGVHISEIGISTLPRLDEALISYECFDSSRRGTGNVKEWVRLIPHGIETRIVPERG